MTSSSLQMSTVKQAFFATGIFLCLHTAITAVALDKYLIGTSMLTFALAGIYILISHSPIDMEPSKGN